jgi:uncharacterized BrkB/YihY/UPF0761 family membrane protein
MDMEKINHRKPRIIRDYNAKNRGRIFLVLNILLFIGSIAIISTLLYILLNLEKSDAIIFKAIPIIVSGLILILFYTIGYYRLTEKGNKHKPFRMQFKEKFKFHIV